MTQHHPFCPHCGYDLIVDAPILINDFSMMGSGQPLFYQARSVGLAEREIIVCWTLMKAFPRQVSTAALIERIGAEDAEDAENLLRVYVCRIRRKLREVGAPNAILTRPHAYSWTTGEDFNAKVAALAEA